MTADLPPVLVLIISGLVGLVLIPLGLPGLWVILLGIIGYGCLTAGMRPAGRAHAKSGDVPAQEGRALATGDWRLATVPYSPALRRTSD
jgi:hypothetical protein